MAELIRLEDHLRRQRDAGRKLLIPYMTGGLGKDWLDVVRAYADAGADAVEVGIPFSDPVMDGPTIQAASEEALAQGTDLDQILDQLRGVDAGIPIVVMTYVNLVFHKGYTRFASEAFLAGVALRTGAFSAAERFFKAGFGRAVLAAGFVLLAVDFVAVL